LELQRGARSALKVSAFIELRQKFFLQMPARGFLDGAPLGRDGFLLRLPFAPGPGFDGAGQMRNLRPPRTDFFLARSGVGIHSSFTMWGLQDLASGKVMAIFVASPKNAV
jgi:hypothetical protein